MTVGGTGETGRDWVVLGGTRETGRYWGHWAGLGRLERQGGTGRYWEGLGRLGWTGRYWDGLGWTGRDWDVGLGHDDATCLLYKWRFVVILELKCKNIKDKNICLINSYVFNVVK